MTPVVWARLQLRQPGPCTCDLTADMRTPGRGPLRGGTPTSSRLAARPRQRAPLPPAGQAGPGGRRTRGGAGRGRRGDEPTPGALRDPRGPRAAESPLGSRLHGEGVTARPGAQLPTAGPAGTPLTAAWQVRPRPGVGFSKDRNAHQCPGALTVSVPERWTSLAEPWELTLPAPPAGSGRRGPQLASPAGPGPGRPDSPGRAPDAPCRAAPRAGAGPGTIPLGPLLPLLAAWPGPPRPHHCPPHRAGAAALPGGGHGGAGGPRSGPSRSLRKHLRARTPAPAPLLPPAATLWP